MNFPKPVQNTVSICREEMQRAIKRMDAASTEQLRVSLPLDLVSDLLALCTPEDHELRERAKQAAYCTPVVPQWVADGVHNALTFAEEDSTQLALGALRKLHERITASSNRPV